MAAVVAPVRVAVECLTRGDEEKERHDGGRGSKCTLLGDVERVGNADERKPQHEYGAR